MNWNWNFDTENTTDLYKFYHQTSSHNKNLQMKKAPRRDYSVNSLDTPNKKLKMKIDKKRISKSYSSTFTKILLSRRTSWDFSEKNLSTLDLMALLYLSFGISETKERKRTYPSGGQFYSIEIYIVPTKRSIESGLFEEKVYKYNVDSEEIVEMHQFDSSILNKISASLEVGFFSIDNSQLLIFLVGNDKDISKKYLDLSYRIMLLETGHMAQNFLLTSTYLGISSVPIGGFNENVIKDILKINESKMILYTLFGG